jgi:4-amino-4-deoxy-L-arabinose transferase-like glycosyltransferase
MDHARPGPSQALMAQRHRSPRKRKEARPPAAGARRPPDDSPAPSSPIVASTAAGLRSWAWRAALAAVVVAAVGLSTYWAVLVPIFQAPDEDVHFDYAVSVFSAGRPLRAAEKPVAEITQVSPFPPYTHPSTWHLALYTEAREIRFHRGVKAPPGYGSRAFYDAINRSAPRQHLPPLRNPWLITEYPSGYYILTALWLAVCQLVSSEVVGLFFAARAFSIFLLAVGLLAIHGALRELGGSPARALGLTAAIGLFPLTSFVSSYVQPDNLAFAATALCLWTALRARRLLASGDRASLLAVGAALGLLLLAKYHVFLSVAIPVLALLAVEQARQPRERRHRMKSLLLLLGPSLLLGAFQLWVTAGASSGLRNLTLPGRRQVLLAESGGAAVYIVRAARAALYDFFGGGTTFKTFWGLFGWLDTPLVIGSPALDEVVDFCVRAGSLVLLALILFRLQQTTTSLVRLWRKGRAGWALRLLVANPLLNSYLLFACMMLALHMWTNNGFLAQGRNWYPHLAGIFWAGVCFAPRALASRKLARLLSRAVLLALLLYAVAGGYWAIQAIEERYYGSQPSRLSCGFGCDILRSHQGFG